MTDHQFEEGDRVRIDIPDETDPDYNRLHGRYGELIEIGNDNAMAITVNNRVAVVSSGQLMTGKAG